MRFARAILTRPAPFTIILVVANIFVFMLMWSSSGIRTLPLWEFPYATLLAYGAKTNELINGGQWWRLVTPMFLHVGLIHLLVNMYGLWMLGPFVERLYGSAKFVFFWVATGVAGVLASYLTVRPDMRLNVVSSFLFKNLDAVSAGASGALFGLIGVLFVFGIKFRHELPEGFKRAFGTGMLPTILLNVVIGFSVPFIDNAAHMGGLVAGAGLALLVNYKRPGERASVAVFWHVLQAAALLLVVASFTMVALRFRTTAPSPGNPSAIDSIDKGEPDNAVFLKAMEQSVNALLKAVNERDASAVAPALEALESAPSLDKESDALRGELKDLLVRAREFATTELSQRDKQQHETLVTDILSWMEKYKQWVQTNGKQYGIFLQQPTPTNEAGKN